MNLITLIEKLEYHKRDLIRIGKDPSSFEVKIVKYDEKNEPNGDVPIENVSINFLTNKIHLWED